MTAQGIKPLLDAFDRFLQKRSLFFSSVLIGGAALQLQGTIQRSTKDLDILDPCIPPTIKQASEDFARDQKKQGIYLDEDWFNNGPISLSALLPEGWRDRIEPLYQGHSLSFFSLSRQDLLKTKLFAYCDRGTDLQDCLALTPSLDEMASALPWVQAQDANPDWPTHVQESFSILKSKLYPERSP